MEHRENSDGFEIILKCNHTENYGQNCSKCGNDALTQAGIELKKCPTCGSKKLSGIAVNKCKVKEKIVFGRLTASEKDKDKEKRIDEALKQIAKECPNNLKNANKPDEYYCKHHAEFHK